MSIEHQSGNNPFEQEDKLYKSRQDQIDTIVTGYSRQIKHLVLYTRPDSQITMHSPKEVTNYISHRVKESYVANTLHKLQEANSPYIQNAQVIDLNDNDLCPMFPLSVSERIFPGEDEIMKANMRGLREGKKTICTLLQNPEMPLEDYGRDTAEEIMELRYSGDIGDTYAYPTKLQEVEMFYFYKSSHLLPKLSIAVFPFNF